MEMQTRSKPQGLVVVDRHAGVIVFVDTTFTGETENGIKVSGRLAVSDDSSTFGFSEVTLRSDSPIEPEQLKAFPWKKMLKTVVDRVSNVGEIRDDGTYRFYPAEQPERSAMSPGPRRRVLDDDHYREVADVYRQALADDDPQPVNRVKEELHSARSTAGRWVGEARKRGFLGAAPAKGKRGEA